MVILGNSEVELKRIDGGSQDLIITSPPYKDSDGYTEKLMYDVFHECFRVQRLNTLFFLNFGHLAQDKFRPFRTCEIAMENGYQLNETITWVKNHYRPIQGKRRVNNLTEFIFVLYKGKMPILNRLAIGVEYADKSNVRRFAGGQDLKCAGNVWYIPYETIQSEEEKTHNDRFPLGLPEKCIKICGYPVKTVIDPFCGSCTTGVVAKRLGKEFIGIEKNPNTYQRAVARLAENTMQNLNNSNILFTPCNFEKNIK